MDVHVLGPVEVLVDGRPVALGATKQRALLAMLALEAGQTVPADRLAEGLWGEHVPASAHKMVQHYVSQLRRLLDGDAGEIVTRGRGYELRLGGGSSDVARFAELLDGERPRPREALRLWRGPPLADVAGEPFAAAEIRRLEELRLRALELAVDADLAAGRHREVLPDVDALVAEHPLSEGLHAQRILALYRSGRQAEALEAYRDARRVLVEEVGVEPGPELRALHEAVLRQDPALDLPRAEPGASAGTEPPRGARGARALVLAAVIALLAGAAVFAIARTGAKDGLPAIGEDGVGRIDDDGTIEARYAVGGTPGAVVAGGGSIWVASERERTVTRIDPQGGRVVTITVGAEPVGLAYGGGSVWVADGATRRVLRIDPRSDRVVQVLELANVPRAIAAGVGSVWVATAVDGGITRIDLERGRVRPPLRIGGSPTALAVGAGSVWAAGESDGTVTRIDARSGTPLRTVAVGGSPAAVAFGGGAVWVANRDDGTLSRLDAASGAVTDTVRVGRAPVAVAAEEGAVWVADAQEGTLSRVDPATRRVTRTVDVGGGPTGLTVAGGSLWAAAGGDAATHRGGTLRVRVHGAGEGSIGSIDPATPEAYTPESFQLMGLVYDGLVAYRRAGGVAGSELVANLAEHVPRPSADGRTYVFRLRQGIRYGDGSPVRAADFRASLERVLGSNEPVAPIYAGIRGAAACGDGICDVSDGIRVDESARTIVIRLDRPDADFLHKLALPFANVLPDGGARRAGGVPPGTGPYRVAAFADSEARFVRNPHFRSWSSEARPPAFPDEIRFVATAHPRVDVRLGFVVQRPSRLRVLATRHGGRLRAEPLLITQYVFLDTRRPPFDDARVRRAVNFAVDRGRVLALVGGDEAGAITCRMIPPGLPGHRPACPFSADATPAGGWTAPDLERARRLVRAAGARGAAVRLIAPAEFGPMAPYLRDVLRDIGLRSRLRVFEDAERYFEHVNSGRSGAHAGFTAWIADIFAPSNFVEPLFTCDAGETNYSRLCDRGLDALVRRAGRAREPSIADARWDAVERRISELAPAVPLVNNRYVTILGERPRNFQSHPLWGPLLDQMWVR